MMDLRSSRSRSRTPFVQLTRLEEENMANAIKQKTIERRTYSTRQKTIEESSFVSDEVFESPVEVKRNGRGVRARHKTSDYSSEEEHTENGTAKSALQVYKEAGEYWNKYPKTDYTYSLHSKDRKELAPGVVCMPNMSRKSLRRSMEPASHYTTDTATYSSEDVAHSSNKVAHSSNKVAYSSNKVAYSSNNVARKALNFDDTTDYTTTTKTTSVYRRTLTTIRSVVTRFYRSIATFFFVVYMALQSSILWTARSYYRTVSRLFLFDTWLMQKTSTPSTKKYGPLIAIMFLPLLLFAGWTLWSSISQIIEDARVIPTKQVIPTNPDVLHDINNILSSPEFEQLLNNRLNERLTGFEAELTAIRARLNTLDAGLRSEIFRHETRKCCRRQFIYLLNNGNNDGQWAELNARINELTIGLRHELNALLNEKFQEIDGTITDAQIRRIVQDSLAVYDADKTGLVDYALESSGGQIVSTRCTENYHSRTAVVSILGVPLWYPSNTPRVIITPGATPGECWAFQNFPGFVVIQLSSLVRINAFSVEHIPEALAPGGARDSAPRRFSVWGLREENDRQPWSFGVFEYRLEGPALQYFAVENADAAPSFNMVELRVESNHGNMNYTCLYRFRVHGNQT